MEFMTKEKKSLTKDELKSCPKCAYKNLKENKKCEKCGFSFNKNKRNVLLSFLFCLFVIVILSVLVYLKNPFIINNFSLIKKIVGGLIILLLLINTLTNYHHQVINLDYSKENNPTLDLKGLKKISSFTLCLAFIIFIILLTYIISTLI